MRDDLIADPHDPYPEGIDGPTAPQVDLSEADAGIVTLFVYYVVLANVVLFLVSLGAMLIGFRGQWSLGSKLILVGMVILAYMLYRYPSRDAAGE